MLNTVMEWFGLIFIKPRAAFNKVRLLSVYLPGIGMVLFFALFSSFYHRWLFSYQIESITNKLPAELGGMYQDLFNYLLKSRFLLIAGVFFSLIVHFFKTSFYLLWTQFFGYSIKAPFLWNSLALASIPSFLLQLILFVLSFFLNIVTFSQLTAFLSLIAWAWSFFLLVLAISVGAQTRIRTALLMVLLPWILLFVLIIVLVIAMIAFPFPFESIFGDVLI